MKLLIGSRAMNHWTGDQSKPDADWDIISLQPIESRNDKRVEWHDQWFLNNEEFFQFASDQIIDVCGHIVHICNPRGLAIIKRSHLWRDLKFDKHITHYHKKLMPLVGEFTDSEKELLKQRIEMTKKEFPIGHPKLNQSVESFFDDAVRKVYDHDWLHTVVAFNDVPLYTKMQRDHSKAWCEKDMWDTFTETEKAQCVAEESLVIAIERFMVPKDWQYSGKFAYMKALNKVCTTLCSGWFRDYAIDNYPRIYDMYSEEKMEEFHKVIATVEKCDTIQP